MYERKKRPPTKAAEPKLKPEPPRSEEEEEKLACGLAMDVAIEWLRDRTAPAQVVCHFLQLQTSKTKLEIKKIESETKLAQAKIEAMEAAKEQTQKYDEVIAAMKAYNGQDSEWEIVPDDYPYGMDYRP